MKAQVVGDDLKNQFHDEYGQKDVLDLFLKVRNARIRLEIFIVELEKAICIFDPLVNVSRSIDLRLNCTIKYARLLSKEQSQSVNCKSVPTDEDL